MLWKRRSVDWKLWKRIPKPEGGHRPISLSNLVVSAYFSARFLQLVEWQGSVCPKQLFGGLRGRSAADAEVPQALWLELCFRQNTPALGVTHDRMKCFDLIKIPFACALLERLGVDASVTRDLLGRFGSQIRFFKVFASCGPPFASASLLQGCPMSVLCCNALFGILARRVARISPHVEVTFFVDDSKMRGLLRYVDEMTRACEEFSLFDQLSGQRLNASKCKAFGTTTAARAAARKLLPPGGQLVYHLLSLGFAVHSSKKGQQELANARCQKQFLPLRRIAHLPFTKDEKLKQVTDVVIPALTYGVLASFPAWDLLMKLRSSVLNAVFSVTQKLREPNVLMAVGFVQHRLDPASAAVYQVFLQLRRAVFACDLVRDAWNHVCDESSVTKQGPLAVLRSLGAFLQWSPCRDRPWTWSRARDVPFSLFMSTGSFKHELRRSLRYAAVQAVHRRKDTGGLVDHHLDWQACSALSVHRRLLGVRFCLVFLIFHLLSPLPIL